jgi:uncharacterized protein (TIGR02996 family)
MSDEDKFVHAILDNPDDDTTRLVFADWLEEHGRASHAELIRTQCELARLPKRSRQAEVTARRTELAEREKALLRQPEFHLKQRYERGFITRQTVGDGELMAPQWDADRRNTLLREGKLLGLEIHPGQGGFQMDCYPVVYEMADLAKHPALGRVTRISVFEGDIADYNLGVLARSPLLTQLRELWLGDCNIHLGAIESLVTSPSIKNLRALYIDVFTIAGARGRDKQGWRLWQLVASSPNMVSLDQLWIDGGRLEKRVAETLIGSPYLKTSLRLDVAPYGKRTKAEVKEMLADLSPAVARALRERFPGNPF